MAFPFLSETDFEPGTRDHFDAESDSANRLDFPFYYQLAQVPGLPAPYRGAACMRVLLNSTTDAYIQETGSWDLSASGAIYARFMLWVSPDITMANADEFAVFQLWSSTNTVEGGIYINYTTANGLRIGIGETAATSFLPLSTGVWHAIELKAVVDAGGGNDGTLDGWVDGAAFTQVAALDQGAITSGILGTVGVDAGTTKGTLLFDGIITDDARIYPPSVRWPADMLLTKSGHVFVGPGEVANVSLLSGGGTDCVLQVWDTDIADTNDASNLRCELKNTVASELIDPAGMPITVERGFYVALSGTNPRALVKVCSATGWGSDGAVRNVGARRLSPRPAV